MRYEPDFVSKYFYYMINREAKGLLLSDRSECCRRSRIKGKVVESKPLTRRTRIDSRNRVMIARYYYWTEIRRLRFDDVMKVLSTQEFFVEDRTITNALLDLSDYLNELYLKNKTTKDLKKEYPGWGWDNN